MNDFNFPDAESDPMNYRTQQPATVAPWFAYAVGCLIALASVAVVVEVLRFEFLMNDLRNREKPTINMQDFRPQFPKSN